MTYTSPHSTAPLKLLKLFIFLFALVFSYAIFFHTDVSADTFYPLWNIASCKFAHTTAIQYSSVGKGVTYTSSDLSGSTSSYIETHRFTDVANPYYPNAKRYAGVADKVSVPPNTRVDIGSYTWNFTGHNVYVDKMSLYLSRPDSSLGDLTRLGAVGNEGTTCWNSSGHNICRAGKKVDVKISSTYGNYGNDYGKILYSFETIQPIKITNAKVIPELLDGEVRYRYEVTVSNTSSYNLCGITLKHTVTSGNLIEMNSCINANSEYKFVYYSNYIASSYPRTISHNTVTVSDPNRHTEIVSIPNSTSFESPEETNVVVYRDDQDQSSPSQAYGTQPGWGSENGTVAVELIPYIVETNSFIEALPELNISKSFRNISAEENGRTDKTYIVPGDKIEFNLKYGNIGEAFAEDVKIFDSISGIEVDKIETINGEVSGNTITWNIPNVNTSKTGELTYIVYTKKNILGQTSMNNTASIEAKEVGKFTTSLNIPIKYPLVRLEKKLKGNSLVTIGDEVIYQIKIINDSDFELTNLILTDKLYEGFVSEEGTVIKRNIDKLLAHEDIFITLKVRVSETEEYSNLDKITNTATLTLDNHSEIYSEADINVRCGNVSGIAWEDSNKDGIVDEDETRLEDALGHIYLIRNNQRIIIRDIGTNETGIYEAVCIPQNREVVVEFEKLEKYTNYSTPISYTFVLNNPELDTVSITSVDSKIYDQVFTDANLGAYIREVELVSIEPRVLAETGDNISDMLLLPIGLLGIPLLVILKKFKRKKFVLEVSSCRQQPR